MNYTNELKHMNISGSATIPNHRLITSIAKELDGADGATIDGAADASAWLPLCWEKECLASEKHEHARVLNTNAQQDPKRDELMCGLTPVTSTSGSNVFHQHSHQPEQQPPARGRSNEHNQQQPPSPYYLQHPHDEQGQRYSHYPPYYPPHQQYYPQQPDSYLPYGMPPLEQHCRQNKKHAAEPSFNPISTAPASTKPTRDRNATTSSKPAAPVLTAWSQAYPPPRQHPGHQEQLWQQNYAAPSNGGSVDAYGRYTPPLVHQQSAPSESHNYPIPAEEYQAPPASSYHHRPQWSEGVVPTTSMYRNTSSQQEQHHTQEQKAVLVSNRTMSSDDGSYYQHAGPPAKFDHQFRRVSNCSGYTCSESPVYYYEDEMMMEYQRKKRHHDNTGETVKPKKKKKNKRPKAADDEPRRPLSAYNFFFSEEKDVVVALLPERASAEPINNNVAPVDRSESSTTEDSTNTSSGCQAMKEEEVGIHICDMDVDKIQEFLVESKGKLPTEDYLALRQTVESQTERTLLAHLEGDKPKKSHKKSHGKISFQKLASVIGKRWHDLSDADKKRYFDLAKTDQERFRKQTEELEQLGKEE